MLSMSNDIRWYERYLEEKVHFLENQLKDMTYRLNTKGTTALFPDSYDWLKENYKSALDSYS